MDRKRIGILGFENVTASHLAAAADAFTAAALDDGYGGRIPCYDVCVVGLTAVPFKAESGTVFQPETPIDAAPPFDTLIIPGGSGLQDRQTNRSVAEWIMARAGDTRRIAAVCTGVFGLAPTGLLAGREVTTHWRYASELARCFPELRVDHKKRVIKDGRFYTSAGLTAGIDLSLLIVEEDYGPQVAFSLRQELVTYLAQRTFTPDSRHPSSADPQPLEKFAEIVSWIVRNLDKDLSVEVLARRACMSPTHFSRSFKSVFGVVPSEFVQNLRLNEARRRLSTRRKTIHSIGVSVGFHDPSTFRRAFERRFGSTPGTHLLQSSERKAAVRLPTAVSKQSAVQ